MSKDGPKYPLDLVRKAAQLGNVYMDRNATKDSKSLGYSAEDVCNCIASLDEKNFYKSIEYDTDTKTGVEIVLDVYKTEFKLNETQVDKLYIKLRL